MAAFAKRYNLELRAVNIQTRVVDDLSGLTPFISLDSSELEDEVAKSVAQTQQKLVSSTIPVQQVSLPLDNKPSNPSGTADSDPASLDIDAPFDEAAYRAETLHLYVTGLRRLAYEHFNNDPNAADGINFPSFTAFMDSIPQSERQAFDPKSLQSENLLSAREITSYSDDLGVQIAFERMVFASRRVASALRANGHGTVARIQDHVHWVSAALFTTETLATDFASESADVEWDLSVLNSNISAGMSADELDNVTQSYNTWLGEPVYIQVDPQLLDEAARRLSVDPDPAIPAFAQEKAESATTPEVVELDNSANIPVDHLPEAKQHLVVEQEAATVVEIDRIWRGLDLENLLDSEERQSKRTPEYHALDAFRQLVAAEKGGLGSLSALNKSELLAFRGWGGVAQDVRTDSRVKSKNAIGEKIAKLVDLDAGQFNRTMLSNRLESYYTPPQLASSLWKIFAKAGVSPHGRFFEPGCGGGYMFVAAPEDVQRHARLVGVERDPLAARLARVVAPDAMIIGKPYEEAVLDRNFDAVIGNVPFGETVITDARYPKAQNIHDYFIVRSLDHLKPGGMMAVITSSGTMDKKDDSVRKQIMERANLVAGFRLPIEAFENQSATVTTDILVFQRRPKGATPDSDFTGTTSVTLQAGDDQKEFTISEYFANNPQNVLGNFTAISSAFGYKLGVRNGAKGDTFNVISDIANTLNERIGAVIPEHLASRTEWPRAAVVTMKAETLFSASEQSVRVNDYDGLVGDYSVLDGKIVEILDIVNEFDDDGILVGTHHEAMEIALKKRQTEVLLAYIPLREAARALVKAQVESSDDDLKAAQAAVTDLYNSFVTKYGPVNKNTNQRIIGDDTGSAEVSALEIWDDDKEVVVQLSDTFTQRVIRPGTEIKAENPEDAYFLSIDQKGRVDLDWMAEVSGISKETLTESLLGHRIFVDPETDEYETADQYLSGNVVRKLEQAQQAVLADERYEINVRALQGVQPEAIPFDQITMRIGANWIPPEEISAFVGDLLNRKFDSEAHFKVRYSEGAGLWSVDVSDGFKRDFEAQRMAVFGTANASMEIILERLLNGQRISHYDKTDDGRTVLNEEATLASRAKQEELNEKFYSWVGNDPDRIERFCYMYNRATNVMRLPSPDGSRLTFPGLSPAWTPYPHQRNMVALSMMGYNDMAAHPVGAGKTFEMVAIAMKLGQLGMHEKPMIAVPNHMLGQISREAKQMYPAARILMITGDDLQGERRRRFFAIARNNKWDLVVCTHSMLNQMSAPLDIVVAEFDKELAVIEAKISETDSKRVERQLQALAKSVGTKKTAAITQHDADAKRKGALTIDQLGIDSISVDEAHLYKNLALNSGMNVLGVTTGGSQRSFNLNSLGEYLRQHHGKSFGLHFFTGTPISNSMCELYVYNKMLRPELLNQMGIHHFDEWANRFGEVISTLEALPEGGGFRINERFARFVNLPEMIKLFRSFADVKSKEQLNLPTPALISNILAVEQSEWQEAFMKHLALRAIAVRGGRVRPHEDNMLSISTAGRKAAMDMRLVHPDLPADSSIKLQTVADTVYQEWLDTADVSGAQLVFMDQGTPGKAKPFTCYDTLKVMLIEKGIPAEQVRFIHEAKTNDAKESLFSQVRSGEIRVFMGSTEKMGVGTNVQTRLSATHDVDCPWRPSDIAQRLGRIERVGNLFFDTVKNFRYTTKDSFDLFMWETNKRKATFIAEGLADPSTVAREVSEEMDMGFAEVMAVTTGNPMIRDKVQTDDKVNKLQRKQRAWFGDRANKMTMRHHLNKDIQVLGSKLQMELDVQEALPASKWRNVTVMGAITDLQDGDTTWVYATEAGEAAMSRLATIEARLMRNNEREMPLNMRIGQIELVVCKDGLNNVSIRGKLHGEILRQNIVNPSKNPVLIGRGLRGWFEVEKRTSIIKNEIAITEKGLKSLEGFDPASAWEFEAELAGLMQEKHELDTWFTSQNFDKAADGPDPFLAMLAAFESDKADDLIAAEIGDVLEEVPSNNDLFAETEFLSFNDTKSDKVYSQTMR